MIKISLDYTLTPVSKEETKNLKVVHFSSLYCGYLNSGREDKYLAAPIYWEYGFPFTSVLKLSWNKYLSTNSWNLN